MKKVVILQLILFISTSIAFAQEKVTNRNGKEITVNKVATTADKGIVKLAGDLTGTADNPFIASGVITPAKIAPGPNNTVLVTDASGAIVWIDKTAFGAIADITTIEGAGTTESPFKVKDLGIVTAKLADNSVTSAKIADGTIVTTDLANDAITNVKIGEIISVTKGGSGSNMSTTAGYVKQATAGANFTTVTTIPVTDVTGAVQSVNGTTPGTNGNVTVSFGTVYTGTLANRGAVVASPTNGDIYVISGDSNTLINGNTFIFDGSTWQEVTANQAALDARYLKLSGGTMEGDIAVPTGKKITLTDEPLTNTDAANKAYVDAQVTNATPDATTTAKGKVKLAGDLGGTADLPTVPGLVNKENTITAGTTTQYWRGDKTWQTLNNAAVGLGNVNNTSDANKPISTATQAALNDKAPLDSATLTGTPTAPTAASGTNSTQLATTAFVTTVVAAATIADATTLVKGKIQLGGDLEGIGTTAAAPIIKDAAIGTNKLANDAVTSAKIADGTIVTTDLANDAITNVKIGEIISVTKGGSGSNMSTTAGYVKQAAAGANFTTVTTIPVTDVTGAVRSVNGTTPGTNGNVTVSFGTVYTGTLANRGAVVASPTNGDIYVISGDSNTLINGNTFIFDGSTWQEVTANQAALDARYLKLSGGTMEGNITVPSGKKITLTDTPLTSTDAANKAYVDGLVTPDATTTSKGKIKLAGDLGGTADAPTVPALSSKIDGTGTINYIPKFTATKTLGNSLLFDNGTNVGLGTTTPVSKFEISDASETFIGNGTVRISNNNSPVINNFAGLVFKSNNVSGVGGSWKIGSNQETTTSYEQNFHFLNSYNGSAYASKMTITPSGFVGIGTINPSAQLHVKGDLGGILLERTGGTAPYDQGFLKLMNKDGGSFQLRSSSGANDGFNITNGNAATNYMTGLSSGNIGIGTTTPANRLEVKHGTDGNSGLRFTNLNSASTATTSSSKVLAVNSTGDVILTNVPGTQNIVAFSTATPTTSGVVFTPNTPADQSVVYQSSVDNSMWTYNGTSYVTYTAPASTAWYTSGTTNDAGNSKTSNIYRIGNVGIGTTAPLTKLHIQGPLATQTINADAQMLRFSRAPQSNIKWDNIAQFNLGSYVGSPTITAKTRLDLAMNDGDGVATSNVMTWQANGNVGINTTAPSAPLVIQGLSGQGSLKFTAPVVNASGDNWWMGFGHGTTSTDANDRARIGAEIISGGSGRLFFTTGAPGAQTRAMFIDESQRVGIGTSTPTGGLTVFGAANSGLTANILGKTDITKEIVFGKGGATKGLAAIAAVDQGGYGGGLAFFTKATGSDNFPTSAIQAMNIDWLGNVGIGTTAPGSKLEVNGSATNTKAYNSGSATAILFNNSNLAYTSASPTAFSLQGMKDGGTYTLAVQGTTSDTSSFIGLNPAGTSFTFKSINNGVTIAGKQTLYTFIVMGTTVYVYMAAGF